MRLSPMKESLAAAVVMVSTITIGITFALRDLTDSPPSVELLHQLAQVGAALLVAYSVTITAAERDLRRRTPRDAHERWLGLSAGAGICGLLGIVAALLVSAHREAGHAGFLADVGFGWAVSSIGVLGVIVASLPVASYEWRKNPE